jgi:hypothetical protein
MDLLSRFVHGLHRLAGPLPIDADVASRGHGPPQHGDGKKLFLGQPFKLEGKIAEQCEDIITPLMVGHEDIRAFSI